MITLCPYLLELYLHYEHIRVNSILLTLFHFSIGLVEFIGDGPYDPTKMLFYEFQDYFLAPI